MVQIRGVLGRHLPLLALLLALSLSTFLYLIPAARINRQSLRYMAAVQSSLEQAGTRPASPEAHPRVDYWQALQALDNGKGEVALALLEPLAAGGDLLALQTMGKAYEALGDLPSAIQIWEQTRNEHALYELADAARQAGELDAAQEAYAAAWQLNPGGDSTAKLATFFWLAKGDPAAAEEVLRWSLGKVRFAGRRAGWLRVLAHILTAQQRWPEAVETYEQLLEEIANDEKAHKIYYEATWAYEQAGQPEGAMAAIEQALALQPANPNYHLRAGQVYESGGEPDKALAAYWQVLAQQPDNVSARQAVERLAGGN
jgi:tetratricopeptide (TPR) repeat protein